MAFVVRTEQVRLVRVGGETFEVMEGTFEIDSFAFATGDDTGEVGGREMGFRARLRTGSLIAGRLDAVVAVVYGDQT